MLRKAYVFQKDGSIVPYARLHNVNSNEIFYLQYETDVGMGKPFVYVSACGEDNGHQICLALPLAQAIAAVKMMTDYLNIEFNGKKHGLLPSDVKHLFIDNMKNWINIHNWDKELIHSCADKFQSDESIAKANEWMDYANNILKLYKGDNDGKSE